MSEHESKKSQASETKAGTTESGYTGDDSVTASVTTMSSSTTDSSLDSGPVEGRSVGGRWNSLVCPKVVALANDLNSRKTFHVVEFTNPDSSDEVRAERAELTRDINKKDLGVMRPGDLETCVEEMTQQLASHAEANAFELKGFNDTNIYRWRVDCVDPEIPETDKDGRRQCVTGSFASIRDRYAKLDKISSYFGKDQWSFDTASLWTIRMPLNADRVEDPSMSTITIPRGEVGNTSTIIFTYTGAMNIKEMPKQEFERMSNILVIRPIMSTAGYEGVQCPGGVKYFKKDAVTKKFGAHTNQTTEIDLEVVYGISAKITTCFKNGEVTPMLRIQQASRLQHADGLEVAVQKAMSYCKENGIQFDTFAEERFNNRKAYTTYGKRRGIWIQSLNHTLNEHSVMGPESMITFKEYYAQKYNQNLGPQSCMALQRGTDSKFPPSLLQLSAQSDDSPLNYGDALAALSEPATRRFEKLPEIIISLNAAIAKIESLKGQIQFANEPERVSLFKLTDPQMTVLDKARTGETTFNPRTLPGSWGKSTGGPFDYRGDVQLKTVVIVHDPFHENEAQALYSNMDAYFGMRKLDKPDIVLQTTRTESGREMDYNRFSSFDRLGNDPRQALVIILPDGVAGSLMKTMATTSIHYNPKTRGIQGRGPQLQCILAKNCSNKNAVLGMCANILLKLDNVFFDLKLPQSMPNTESPFAAGTWVFGVSVAHNGDRKPSIACAVLVAEPLRGTTRSTRARFHLNRPRTQLIPGRVCQEMFWQLLEEGTEMSANCSQDGMIGDNLPKTIVFLRDGLADDQIKECIEEEIAGFQTAVSKWTTRAKVAWRPRIIYLVNPKQGIEDFCAIDANGIRVPCREPVVMASQNATSSQFLSFQLLLNPKERTGKPKRFIVLRDDGGLCRTTSGFLALCNFLLACTWSWAYGLPMSTGNTAIPAAIKFASKYSELAGQFITNRDRTLTRFLKAPSVNRPKITITTPLPNLTG